MMNRQKLIESFGFTHSLIHRLVDGITSEESVMSPPFRGNSSNWVLGHIVYGRNMALLALGAEPVLSDEQVERYQTGSDPVTPDQPGVSFPKLLTLLDRTQEQLAASLGEAADEALSAMHDEEKQLTVGARIDQLHWHETYHLGQFELLRQIGREKPAVP